MHAGVVANGESALVNLRNFDGGFPYTGSSRFGVSSGGLAIDYGYGSVNFTLIGACGGITAPDAPQNLSVSANPSINGSYSLSWSAPSSGGTSEGYLVTENGVSLPLPSSRNYTDTALNIAGKSNGTYLYEVFACNDGTNYNCGASASISVTVDIAPPGPPSITVSASPSTVIADIESVTLTWNSANADYCTYGGTTQGITGSIEIGSYPVGNHTDTLSCTGPFGTTSETVNFTAIAEAGPTPGSSTATLCSAYPNAPSYGTSASSGLSYSVTGSIGGAIYGTNTYHGLSTVVKAAIHSGAVSNGQSAIIRITKGSAISYYVPSTRFGVSSSTTALYPQYGSFTIQFIENCVDQAPVPPASPQNLSISANPSADGSYSLSWSAPATGATPEGYIVTENGVSLPTPASRNYADTSLSVTGKSDGTYFYEIFACNEGTNYNCGTASTISVVVDIPTLLDTDNDGIPNIDDLDDDNDGMSDVCEATYGFDPLDDSDGGITDTDGDGISNADECVAGSDPTDSNDPNAAPTITASVAPASVIANEGTVTYTWSSTDADYCTFEGTTQAVSGDTVSGPFPDPGTITNAFSCTGPGGTTTESLTFTVDPQPVSTQTDTDGDGLTDDIDTDDDNDGMSDVCEATHLFDPLDASDGGLTDTDGDEISNVDECIGGTDPRDINDPPETPVDTDGDGEPDDTDTDDDNDGMLDVCEITYGFDPLDASDGGITDTDGDGVSNADECANGTDPTESVAPLNLVGFDDQYRIYGKPSSTDLFVSRDNFDGNNAGVSGFYLQTNSGSGSQFYNLVYPVTETQASNEGFNVGVPLGFQINVADLNSDGTFDLLIEGLEGSSVPGRMNTIVYSRATTGSMPLGYKEIDQEFKDFFQQTNAWIDDQNYFINAAPVLATVPEWNLSFALATNPDTGITYFGAIELPSAQLPLECDGITAFCTSVYGDSDLFDNGMGGLSFAYTIDDYHIFIEDQIDDPSLVNGYYLVVLNILSGFSLTETVDVKDYSGFNQGALTLAASPLSNYLTDGVSDPSVLADIWQVISELFGVTHAINDEPGIINNIKVFVQILFGVGVPQDLPNQTNLNRVELLFTDIGWAGLPPLARHAYVLVTTPSGTQYVTRGGPENPPSYGLFGELTTQINSTPISDAFLDKGITILFRQLVGYIPDSEAEIESAFIQYTNATNSAVIDYNLFVQNSNSYAFQVVEKLTQKSRPKAIPYAPGWSKILLAP